MDTKHAQFLASQGFTTETLFYRYTLNEYITEIEDGSLIINANPAATEMVEDIYNSGHILIASEIGPGLSFTKKEESDFKTDQHMLVSLRLGDIIQQNGKVYPDKSTYTSNAVYITIPEGFVKVSVIQ